jgi:beta-lactamase superfamily II metal-dependent hydrolase
VDSYVITSLHEDELDAPAATEVEVTFLGPGFGETALMHMGQGKWIVVDSCVDLRTQSSLALDYLRKIDVDPSSVFMVLATHWHDDHIRGLSQIVEAASDATFVCSAAIQHREFYTLVASANRTMSVTPPGVEEMAKILETLTVRSKDQAKQRTPVWAKENSLLWEGHVGSLMVRVQALAPSDLAMTRAVQSFGRLMPQLRQPKRVLPAPRPNESSVVLWVTVGELGVLFGGDLEETVDAASGWKRVVSNPLRKGRASVFKLPHHGSANAFNADVWETMLTTDPIVAIIPFRNGRVVLPTADSVKRYCTLSEDVFLTVPPDTRHTRRRVGTVEKLVRMSAGKLTDVLGAHGVIRIRTNLAGDESEWRVGLVQPAYSACR